MVLWVDILTHQEALKTPAIKISGPEKKKFEIRIVCWRSLDVPALENGVSDMFVSFFMEGGRKQSTDTHWRCKSGKGSWNWRVKIPVELPMKTRELGRLRVQMWERNIIRSNQIIGMYIRPINVPTITPSEHRSYYHTPYQHPLNATIIIISEYSCSPPLPNTSINTPSHNNPPSNTPTLYNTPTLLIYPLYNTPSYPLYNTPL